jgi:hypothetical protein
MTAVSGWLLSWPTSWHNAFHGREQIPNFGKSSSSIATCNERTSDYRVYQPFEDATDARRGFPGVYHSLTFSNMSFFCLDYCARNGALVGTDVSYLI